MCVFSPIIDSKIFLSKSKDYISTQGGMNYFRLLENSWNLNHQICILIIISGEVFEIHWKIPYSFKGNPFAAQVFKLTVFLPFTKVYVDG